MARNDAILLQHCYASSPYHHLLELSHSRHLRYCASNKMDFHCLMDNGKGDGGDGEQGDWRKVELILEAMDNYAYVIWMDADAFILDVRFDLRSACIRPLNLCVYDNPKYHPQTGVLYWRSCPEAKELCKLWQLARPGQANWWEQTELWKLIDVPPWSDAVGVLHAKMNCTRFINNCDDPVVIGYHGMPDLHVRAEQMRKEMKAWNKINTIGV
jgi:galactosyl transferase GMA12/MNN10 family